MTSIYTNNSYNHFNNNNDITPSLNQGDLFKNYQKKIKTKTKTNDKYSKNMGSNNNDNNLMEGFDTNAHTNSITEQSQNLLKQTEEIKANKKKVSELKTNYKSSLTQYDGLIETRSTQTQDYYDRIDPVKNPYLNQNICIGKPPVDGVKNTDDACGYVTNQGVFKWYPADNNVTYNNTAGKNGCPSTAYVKVNGEVDINAIGSMTTTKPPLLIGTPMVSGQSCGYEGNNVYVDKMLPPDIIPKYLDVYGTRGNPNIKFIGGAPPEPPPSFNGIQNGNFDTPRIKNNSYEYINSASRVPGWEFKGKSSGGRGSSGAVLINRSKAWNFPSYPFGEQAVSIQERGHIHQTLYMPVGTYLFTLYAVGRPCCSKIKGFNPLNIQLDGNKTIYTIKPTGKWEKYSIPITITKNGNHSIHIDGTVNNDNSTAIQKLELVATSEKKVENSVGTYTYDMCKESAMINGYQYFGLQDVNIEKSKGYCAVTNDYVSLSSKGQNKRVGATIILWESKTGGQGVNASLNRFGTLEVFDSSGKTIFSTPNDKAVPSNYFGCYNDRKNRAMGKKVDRAKHKFNYESCRQKATNQNYGLFGLQDTTTGENGQCFLAMYGDGSGLNMARRYGKATNCTKLGDGKYSGGVWSNAVYVNSDTFGVDYCLWVHDDGLMEITRGSGPRDNQGEIWNSGTKDKVQDANPLYIKSKGKYREDWVTSNGATLAKGEFIGSLNGKCALVMQMDGNLVLCTWQMEPNQDSMSDGNNGGGQGAAGFYDFSKVGIRQNFGKVGFVDENSGLHEYPETNLKFTTNYTKFTGVNCPGSDIPNAAYDNSTIEKCETTCNSMEECAGFVFEKSISRCWPKDKGIYPNSDIYTWPDGDTYIRTKEPVKLPNGIQNTNSNFSTKYTTYSDVNFPGSDIPNAAYNNSSVEKCEATCNSMENCSGFVFQKDNNRCWPKNKGEYQQSGFKNDKNNNTYVRLKEKPVDVPDGLEKISLIGVDTILYDGYTDGGGFNQKFGLEKALEKIQQKVATKGKQLNTFGSNVQGLTSLFSMFNDKLTEQSSINLTESDAQLDELDKTKGLIANMDNGIDNILNDTDIMVLQKNYSYLFWSIIAIGTVIVSMNIIKKKSN